MKAILLASALTLTSLSALAAPVTYKVNAAHTYPSFEADHMGGLSVLRGKFNASSGTIVFDKEAKAGTVEITIDMASLDFGHDKLNEHAKGDAAMFDVAKYPTATYKGKLASFKGDSPTEVQGELTLHGVTKPVTLKINQFLCKQHPMTKKEVCGADASGTFNRADFGVDYGVANFGFKPQVKLSIEVEADIAS
ncbi:MAG: YceI family protein [Gammaproteobacteria bacterium]